MKNLFLLLSLCLLIGCSSQEDQTASLSDFALDTMVSMKIYGSRDQEILEGAMDEIHRLEAILSVHSGESDIAKLNGQTEAQWQDMHSETVELLNQGLHYAELSGGLMDLTAGPLIDLWRISPPNGHVPTQEELQEIQGLVNHRNLQVNSHQARLLREGMKVNLGAIAKGYIADQVKSYLQSQGVERAIINLGGNILLVGSKPGKQPFLSGLLGSQPEDRPFRIGIQDPLSDRGADLAVIEITDASLVSSGDYERYFIDSNGEKYHHILNPRTGYPSDNGLIQVTVISPTSIEGDGLSTSLFLMGLDEGMDLVERIPQVDAIFVTQDKEVYVSSGMEGRIQFTGSSRGYILQ